MRDTREKRRSGYGCVSVYIYVRALSLKFGKRPSEGYGNVDSHYRRTHIVRDREEDFARDLFTRFGGGYRDRKVYRK